LPKTGGAAPCAAQIGLTVKLSDPAILVATWFGCGLAPVAPGTAGSLAAVVIAYVLPWRPMYFTALAIALTPIAIWAAGVTARETNSKDPQIVVVDEVLGQWITLGGASVLNWKSSLAAFVLFRLFDIWKPPPVRRLEALPGGTGIVADDLMAGLYGALVLFLTGCFNLY
jgi:phosphatidylglycerophosphatase A